MISKQEGESGGYGGDKVNFSSKNNLEVPRADKVNEMFYSPKETTKHING